MSTSAILRTEGLVRKFGELTAVDDVSLEVDRGEFRSIIGPNGAGKTTFFNLISGKLFPNSGTIYFKDEAITDLSPQKRVKRGMARSFQITNIFSELTVLQNVMAAVQADQEEVTTKLPTLGGGGDIDETAERIVDRIGLVHHADSDAGTLSHGQQRRLELGIILGLDPDLVMLDEPTAGMTKEEAAEIVELIDETMAEKTIILVEHDMEVVMDVSDSITVLHQGRVLAEGTQDEVRNSQRVQEVYLGE